MIVNPQLFNYKITIGTLVVACTVLAAFSYYNYSSSKAQQDFLMQEKKLLENQISEMITSHDNLGTENKELNLELQETKRVIDKTNDSMDALKANLSLIHTYKKELASLKEQRKNLIKQGDSFSEANQELLKQNETIATIIEKQLEVISMLKEENITLDNNLKNAALIKANSFNASAYDVKHSGEIVKVDKAAKAKQIRVDFVLAENELANVENKELYIQIIGPDNNIVADKGAVKFDESTLIYSSKVNVNYTNQTTDVSTDIWNEENFVPGLYYVSVYENNRRLGGTKFELN